MSFLDREIERIRQSGVLGRSPVYERLLAYLKETTEQSKSPREIDIAVDVFGRHDFDSGSDSFVRVYLHNLRQKLDNYYNDENDRGKAEQTEFIYIPKGQYRLQVGRRGEQAIAAAANSRVPRMAALAGALLGALIVGWSASSWFSTIRDGTPAAETAVWQPILQSERPLVLVIGDYYMFAEVDRDGVTRRLIRDFGINRREDLEAGYADPAAPDRDFADIRLNYLPLGAAPALVDILNVIYSSGKTVVLVPESQLDIQTVRTSDIVYVGYLSGLGKLSEFVFASSRFVLGSSYDELVDRRTGKAYLSEAGFLDGPATDYLDYGLLSTFAGPAGNRLLVIAGMRDEALMQMASILSSAGSIEDLMGQLPENEGGLSFEALYRVRGMHRMNIASTLLLASTLDAESIWTGTLVSTVSGAEPGGIVE